VVQKRNQAFGLIYIGRSPLAFFALVLGYAAALGLPSPPQSYMLASHFLLRAPEAIKSLWLAAFGRHASKPEV
jgi:hypothetical protein